MKGIMMKKRLNFRQTVTVASMLFGLFFGAGNLIFPIHMGQLAGSNSAAAIIGFIATGVGLPLLGVAALAVSHSGGLLDMAGRVGKNYSKIFTCALYLTIGPLFAIPRCATTSFTVGLEPMFSQSSAGIALALFSLAFFALVLYFSLRPGKILTYIGKVINPVFLVFLAILIVTAFIKPMGAVSAVLPDGDYASAPFLKGFLEGYNTVDALAALAFGIIVVDVIKDLGVGEADDIAFNAIKAGVFTCVLMGLIYTCTTLVGAQTRGVFETSANGGIALGQLAGYYFPGAGQLLLAATVCLACLKTAIGLITSSATTFNLIFPELSYKKWAIIFCAFSFAIANVGLTVLIQYSIPVLMLLYPLAMMLIFLNLFGRYFNYDRAVFVSVTAFTFAAAIFDFINNLPAALAASLHLDVLLSFAARLLPFFNEGLGWVCPSLIGLVVGIIVMKAKKT